MKSSAGCPDGWLLPLIEAGCKASHNTGLFGRTEWMIKKGGDFIVVQQGKNTGLSTVVAAPSALQTEIIMLMVSVGVASITAKENKHHAA